MKKRFRLTGRRDFQRLLGSGRIYAGRGLVGFAVLGRTPESRVGVGVSRQLRGALAKNRARRRIREVVRLRLLGHGSGLREAGISYDVLLIARPAALQVPFRVLEEEAESFLRLLSHAR